jgi:thiosulfate dehydrogenase (quinone) large subunit
VAAVEMTNTRTGRAATALRIAFGVIWAIDAWLKWQPGFRATMLPSMVAAAQGQPHWLEPWFDFWIHLMQHPTPDVWVDLIALTETVIAVLLLAGLGRRVVYIGGALYSLSIWSTAEGFGGPYTAGATDVGTSIIYVLVFMALLVKLEHGLDHRLALDPAIARRVPWWHYLAGPSV